MINTNLLRVLKASDKKLLPSVVAVAIGLSLGSASGGAYSNETELGTQIQNSVALVNFEHSGDDVLDDPATSATATATLDDLDGDGIANINDLDDDSDSLLDTEEGMIDADQDGIPDANSTDTDSDGIPDSNDLDSDNDGILDLVEGRLPTSLLTEVDPQGVGSISDLNPVGNNGVADIIETAPDSSSIFTPILDTDNDGTPNFQDIDSDADGIVDLVEAGGVDMDFDGRVDTMGFQIF